MTDNIAIGTSAKTDFEDRSIAIGYYAYTYSLGSIAIGAGSYTGKYFAESSTAIGRYSRALGYGSVAIGRSATVGTDNENWNTSGYGSVAIGYQARAAVSYGVAIGYESRTTQQFAVAIGRNARAYNTNSIAIGNGAVADAFENGKSALAFSINTDSVDTNNGYLYVMINGTRYRISITPA